MGKVGGGEGGGNWDRYVKLEDFFQIYSLPLIAPLVIHKQPAVQEEPVYKGVFLMLCVMKFYYTSQHFSFQMVGWLWSFSGSPYVLSQANSKTS